MLSLILLLELGSFVTPCHAIQQFRHWLPYYTQAYLYKWNPGPDGPCSSAMNITSGPSWCENIADCILKESPELQKANMAGAGVLLGLLPSLLITIAPSEIELSVLADHRPILAYLLAAGSMGVYRDRLFSGPDADLRVVYEGRTSPVLWRPSSEGGCAVLMALQYLFALASVGSSFHLGVEFAFRTVTSWSCPNPWWTLGWTAAMSVVFVVSALMFRLRTVREVGGGWSEFTPCCYRTAPIYRSREGLWGRLAFVGPVLAVAHWVLGTAILSSVVFVPFRDAIPVVLRWVASAVVARAVVFYELASFKEREESAKVGLDSSVGQPPAESVMAAPMEGWLSHIRMPRV